MNTKFLFTVLTLLVLSFATARPAHATNGFFSRFGWGRHEDEKPKHHKRSPHPETTEVTGIVFDGDKDRVNGDKDWEVVTVTCNGVSKTVDISGDGVFSVSFKRKQCEGQSPLTVSAVTEVGSGSTTTNIENDPDEGTWADVYLTLYDINVPEYGPVAGLFTTITAIGGYLFLKSKTLI